MPWKPKKQAKNIEYKIQLVSYYIIFKKIKKPIPYEPAFMIFLMDVVTILFCNIYPSCQSYQTALVQ